MYFPSVPTEFGTMPANEAVRVTENQDVRAHAAGDLAWWATFLHYSHECDAWCEPGCNEFAESLADADKESAIARVYARAARKGA